MLLSRSHSGGEDDPRDRIAALWTGRDRNRAAVRVGALACPESPQRQVLLAYLDWRSGELERVLEALEPLRATLPPDEWRVRTLGILGNVRGELELPEAALALFHEQLGLARECGDQEGEILAVHDLGVLLLNRDPKLSRSYLEQALDGARAHGFRAVEMMALFNLTVLDLNSRSLGTLDLHLAELFEMPAELNPDLAQLRLVLKADQAMEREDHDTLQAVLGELRTLPPSDSPTARYNVTIMEARLATVLGDPAQAAARIEELITGSPEEYGELLKEPLSQAYEAAGNLPEALRCARELSVFWQSFLGGQRERQVRALEVMHRTEQTHLQAQFERQRAAELEGALSELRAAHDRILELSTRDILTGLHNRLHLMETGPGLLDAAGGAQLAVIDVDRFKSINDRYGHAAGDEVLRGLASQLKLHLRPHDLAVRFGGDEFVVIRPGPAGQPGDTELAADLETFAHAFAARQWTLFHEPVTVSVGITRSGAGQLDGALIAADLEMYAAKHAGGNRVSVRRGRQHGPEVDDSVESEA